MKNGTGIAKETDVNCIGTKSSHFNMIPFTVEQFLSVFARYNVSVWPAPLFLYALGILVLCLALQRKADFSKTVSLILAIFWTWMGVVYHFWFFRGINRAALIFAVFFVLQGILFFIAGVCKQQLSFALHQISLELLVAHSFSIQSSSIPPSDTG